MRLFLRELPPGNILKKKLLVLFTAGRLILGFDRRAAVRGVP